MINFANDINQSGGCCSLQYVQLFDDGIREMKHVMGGSINCATGQNIESFYRLVFQENYGITDQLGFPKKSTINRHPPIIRQLKLSRKFLNIYFLHSSQKIYLHFRKCFSIKNFQTFIPIQRFSVDAQVFANNLFSKNIKINFYISNV